ncbi:MAG TPA: hypothetical protein VI391_04815, partial [Thermoanaerobaculia bacterium]
PATLRFAAVDGPFSGLVDKQSVTASWKLHGSVEWLPLPVVFEADDFGGISSAGHFPAGSIFASDLSTVTQSALGAVDLRVHAADGSGNAIDYTVSPAIVVSANGRRRAAH